MKKALFILLFFGLNIHAFAQNPVVSGQVKDKEFKKPLPYVTVSVYSFADSTTEHALTDNNGFFEIPLKPGNYSLSFSFIGYKADTLKITVENKDIFLGTIKMDYDAVNLDKVTVEGKVRESQVDKEVVLVTEDMRAGAATAKDVFDKVQGVNYDRYNNTITVDGDKNIILLVNGLQKDPEYIKNLNPERIKKIEVIRDPGGRYGLEGYSAILNVILKENYKGQEFFISAMPIIDPVTNEKEPTVPIGNTYGNINLSYNKLNLYTSFFENFSVLGLLFEQNKHLSDGTDIEQVSQNDGIPNLGIDYRFSSLTVGADYLINPKHTVSFESNIHGFPFNQEKLTTDMLVNVKTPDNEYSYTTHAENNKISHQYDNTIFYIGKFDEKNSLNADFTYSRYNDNYTNTLTSGDMFSREENGINTKDYTQLNLEFNHSFSKKISGQIGYGNVWKHTYNSYSATINSGTDNISENNTFSYYENRNRFYSYLRWKASQKLSFKAGLAAEISIPHTAEFAKTFTIWQPYFDMKYNPMKYLEIKLKYRVASRYPTIEQVTPFVRTMDEQSYSVGNPKLAPEATHKLSLKFNVLGGLLSVEPYYNFSNNYIAQTGYLDQNGYFVYSYDNIGKYEHRGVKVNVTVPLGKSVFWQNQMDFYYSKVEYNGLSHDLKDWTMNSNLIYQNKKYKTVAGFIYQNDLHKSINALGYQKVNNDFWAAFVQQPFFKEKLNVMILYTLPINLGADYYQGNYVETPDYVMTNSTDLNLLKGLFMIQVSYRFSKGSVRKTKKEVDIEKEAKSKSIF